MSIGKNKGFTLIELLAVIVIISVIALIATPIIMNVIDKSKNGAAKDSAYGYIKAVELELVNQVLNNNVKMDGSYLIDDGNLMYYNSVISKVETLNVSYKGTKPKGTIVVKENALYSADLVIDGYSFGYFNEKLTEKEKGNLFPTMKWQSNSFSSFNGQPSNIMKDGAVTLSYTGITTSSDPSAYIQTYGEKSTEYANPKGLYQFGILVEPNTTYEFIVDTDLTNHSKFSLFAFKYDENFSLLQHHRITYKNTITFTTEANVRYMAFRVDINGCTIGNFVTFSNFRLLKK